MDVVDIYFVGGFGVMGWVAASEYSQARPDPLVDDKIDIMHHMNADYKDALNLLAKRFADVEAQDAEMTSVDRLGFHLCLKTKDGVRGTQIAFLREVATRADERGQTDRLTWRLRRGRERPPAIFFREAPHLCRSLREHFLKSLSFPMNVYERVYILLAFHAFTLR